MDKFNNDISKLADFVKKSDLYKKNSKKDKPKKKTRKSRGASITDDLPVVNITAMLEVSDPASLREISETMVDMLKPYAYSAESAPFMIGPICGLGFRAILRQQDSLIGMRDILDYLETNTGLITLKELDMVSGTAREMPS